MTTTVKKERIVIPTYPVGVPEPLPMYFEKRPYQGASGKVYPIPYTSAIGDERDDNREYEAIVLENDWVRVELLPEIGFLALQHDNIFITAHTAQNIIAAQTSL